MTRSPLAPPAYSDHLRQVQRAVREALAELLEAVRADPGQPQELARRFGLNHTTSWKVCRVIRDADPHAFLQHMLGTTGVRILVRRLREGGAPEEVLARVEEASAQFERMIETHAGDRPTLERMAIDTGTEAVRQQREVHRKLSFRGNSCTWGVQAEAQLLASFVFPSETGGMVDYVKVGGLIGFRRLREDATWPLITTSSWEREDELDASVETPLFPEQAEGDGLPILREFSSDPLPALRQHDMGKLRVVELGEGPVGITGATTCLFGLVTRRLGAIHRGPDNPHGEYSSILSTPAKAYVGDLFVHRDLEFALDVEPVLYSRLGAVAYPDAARDHRRLPLAERLEPLGCPPDVTCPEVPRYARLVEAVLARVGHSADEFHGLRLRLGYPPIPSTLSLRHPLLEPGA